ncbi:NEP1-interacting protein 1-like isoform X3 [Musa acuminata AAA Group]|uniref:NEP1-interacting protein 1 isoform X3 n=1 Tax=Musa acuminata AAA Group TaxID=214697 RepID=UPI0031D19C20
MQYLSDIKCLISSHGSILALFAFFVSINSSPVNASSNHSLEGLKPHTMEGLWWKHSGFEHWLLCVKIVRKVAFAVLTCTFALCGSLVGLISGAVKGQTTETGLFRGAGIGAISGAIVSVDVLESCFQGEILSKLDIFDSLLDGKIFREWVSPALLKAYQWQINATEPSYRDSSDIFDVNKDKGLLPNVIRKLPMFEISPKETIDSCGKTICCAVCLQCKLLLETKKLRRSPANLIPGFHQR